jgi:hypothetical protein
MWQGTKNSKISFMLFVIQQTVTTGLKMYYYTQKVIWVVIVCSSEAVWHFCGTYCLHVHGQRLSWAQPVHYKVTNQDHETNITNIYSQKRWTILRKGFMIFKVAKFVVMTVRNVLRAGKSWQVSLEIKLSFVRNKTLTICMHSCILQLLYPKSVEDQGKGKHVWQGEDNAQCFHKQAKI